MAHRTVKWLAPAAFVVFCASAGAQQQMSMQDAASRAVLTNPEVLSRLHTFNAAGFERRIAFGNFLPSVEVAAGIAAAELSDPLVTTSPQYTQSNVSVIVRQLLFDGFATPNDVRRLDYARRVRYYELLDISETAALEAVRAYQDVLRYRELVRFAEENYAEHRVVSDQLSQRAKQGVARGVDLETSTGRLALAESNLLTETSNLYDVSARFQRIVGEKPAPTLMEPKPLGGTIPANAATALQRTFEKSPALLASIENVQAAQADVEVKRGPYMPRVEARLQHDTGRNISGVPGHTGLTIGELALRWNIYNGGRDQARVNQYAQLANVAKDLRDKTCRDVRQTVLVALNDVNKLREQAAYLDQHQLSSDKARQAFRNQFDIGQRTLLDLLDTENEYFQSRRAYINAVHDLAIAQARLHAGMGNLLATLGIAPVEPNAPKEVEGLTPEAMERCPAEGPDVAMVDKARAIERAMRLRPQRPSGPVAEPGRTGPVVVPSTPSSQGPKSLAPPPRPISPAQPRESVGPVAPSLPPAPR